jgi:hypothetical protein
MESQLSASIESLIEFTYHFANGKFPRFHWTTSWFDQKLLENFVKVRWIFSDREFGEANAMRSSERRAFCLWDLWNNKMYFR